MIALLLRRGGSSCRTTAAASSLTTLRRHFAVAKELAGITRRFRLHDLRHTAASKMASAGVPLQVIAEVLVELVFDLLDLPEKKNAARPFVTFAASVTLHGRP